MHRRASAVGGTRTVVGRTTRRNPAQPGAERVIADGSRFNRPSGLQLEVSVAVTAQEGNVVI
jgi:hypothetical protein